MMSERMTVRGADEAHAQEGERMEVEGNWYLIPSATKAVIWHRVGPVNKCHKERERDEVGWRKKDR